MDEGRNKMALQLTYTKSLIKLSKMPIRRKDTNRKFFLKDCKKCGKEFRPRTKFSYVCEDCIRQNGFKRRKIIKNEKT